MRANPYFVANGATSCHERTRRNFAIPSNGYVVRDMHECVNLRSFTNFREAIEDGAGDVSTAKNLDVIPNSDSARVWDRPVPSSDPLWFESLAPNDRPGSDNDITADDTTFHHDRSRSNDRSSCDPDIARSNVCAFVNTRSRSNFGLKFLPVKVSLRTQVFVESVESLLRLLSDCEAHVFRYIRRQFGGCDEAGQIRISLQLMNKVRVIIACKYTISMV
jgi:hypothetical protein